MEENEIKELKINQAIDANEVILIDQEGKSQGKVSLDQALYLAYENDLDLVQVSAPPAGGAPVVKIMDYGKYRYAQAKQQSRQKVHTRTPEIKEIRIGLKINPHDLDFKMRQAQKFLESGDKVKITVKLMGREMMFRNRVQEILENFKNQTNAEFEGPMEKLGNRFSVILRKNNETKNS